MIFRFLSIFLALAVTGPLAAVHGAEVTLQKRQALIKGLLVADVGGDYVGKASQMNATAVPDQALTACTLKFNQAVGEDMEKALAEVRKFLTVRHGAWPGGHAIEISFEDKYGAKDGPSAAVACALLLDSLITGKDIDQAMAVTGDLNADGSVQPVGAVADKLRGAIGRQCRILAVPEKCRNQVLDSVLSRGEKALLEIQVFTIAKFDDAARLAATEKDEALKTALATYEELRTALLKQPVPTNSLRHPKVIEKLRAVVQAAPNHLSAQILLLTATDKLPRVMSPAGSLQAIERGAALIMQAAKSKPGDTFRSDAMADAVAHLRKVRPLLDSRVQHYADSLVQLGSEVRQFRNAPPRSPPEQNKAMSRIIEKANAVDAEVERIRSDKSIMEELMR